MALDRLFFAGFFFESGLFVGVWNPPAAPNPVEPGAALTADDGTTALTADDGVTALTADS